jgi:hypothetical protein
MPLRHTTLRLYVAKQNEDHVIMTLARGNNSRVNALNMTRMTCIHYSVQFTFLTDVCNRAHHLLILIQRRLF